MTTVAVQAPQEILEGSVKEFEFASFNVNEMQPVEFAALVNDMREHGIYAIGPVAAVFKQTLDPQCKDAKWKVVIDGNSRLKAAMELGWPKIRYYVDQSVKTEADARVYVYRRSAERGKINELRLAEAFKWFVDSGFSQKQVAEKFGIDPSTVSHKLSLLKVDPELRKDIASDTRLGMSALEVISTKPVEIQKKVLDSIRADGQFRAWKDGQVPVRWVEAKAQEASKLDSAEKAFAALLDKAKFKTCPTCHKPPHFPGINYDLDRHPLFECDNVNSWEHKWDPMTGDQANKPEPYRESSSRGSTIAPKVKKGPDQFIRLTYTKEDFEAAFAGFVRELIPKLGSVGNISVTGKVGGKWAHLSINGYGSTSAFSYLQRKEDGAETSESFSLTIEHQNYQIPSLKHFKTTVRGGNLRGPADQQALEKKAVDFLAKYGNAKAPVEPESQKRKPGRPPGSKNKPSGSKGEKGGD